MSRIKDYKEIQFKKGGSIKFKEFTPKESNLIKIRMHSNGEDSEGIWACISDEDKKAYDADKTDSQYTRVAILRNTSLFGIPWGAYIPYKLKGTERPECDVNLFQGTFIVNLTATEGGKND